MYFIPKYSAVRKATALPRIPLEGKLDLTYRCNNNCLHCWLWIPPDAEEKKYELSFEEIRKIVDEAKSMGCRRWSISGGEPLLRPDFADIFQYLANNAATYSLNTNGTLITPKIARLMKKEGMKMIALYGATAKINDHITRNVGSFEAAMRGLAYLKEADADFAVQIILMRDNYHQFKKMVRLAESLSPRWRIGAEWLFLSASGDAKKNKEISRQRLSPKEVIELNKPDLIFEERLAKDKGYCQAEFAQYGHLFSSCVASKRDFHIDSYGRMSFCPFVKDPKLRYNLRTGSFMECWDRFIPSLADKVQAAEEYLRGCGPCVYRQDCRWCPAYAYLEHRNFSTKIEYLCAVARASRQFKEHRKRHHRRFFRVAGITIQVESDLPMSDSTFHPDFAQFKVAGPGEDTISIRHHFFIPDLQSRDLGREVYRWQSWSVYQKNGSLVYSNVVPGQGVRRRHKIAVFHDNYNRVEVYHRDAAAFRKGNLRSLTLLATDQVLLAPVLAERQGCYLHACGVDFQGKGLLFLGHSGAGKSTVASMVKPYARILCDDRIIVRRNVDGFHVYGNWGHGKISDISAKSAPLRAILFLEKSKENRLALVNIAQLKTRRLLDCLIRPYVTTRCWEKSLELIERIVQEVPCYTLEFDTSGKVGKVLEQAFSCAA